MKRVGCDLFGGVVWRVGGSICTGWVGLYVIVVKMKIYSYINVGKIPYPQDISKC
jgi:hypothetical protein